METLLEGSDKAGHFYSDDKRLPSFKDTSQNVVNEAKVFVVALLLSFSFAIDLSRRDNTSRIQYWN
jgi:hypothetical protein